MTPLKSFQEDFGPLAREVCIALLGDPNLALSKADELRFGRHGSLAVDLAKGTWFDHECSKGGGVLDLIMHKGAASTRRQAVSWLERKGMRGPCEIRPAARLDKCYSYLDEDGQLLFEVCRFIPKTFKQRQPEPNSRGGWNWTVKGVRQVPYRLPQMLADLHAVVFIVEGEKDADALAALGLVATCNAGGAGKWRDELSQHFASRNVVVLPDNDDAGREHARLVTQKLLHIATQVRTLDLPGLPPKGDVSDWIDGGGTRESLLELVAANAVDARRTADARSSSDAASLEDFHAHMPTHTYLFVPTRDLWPAASVNGRITGWPNNPATQKPMKPSDWLDAHRPIEQMTWHPDEPELIADRVMHVNGWASHTGARVFNLYRPPALLLGDALRAERWRSHLRAVYPIEAEHIEKWLAQRIQRPGVKVNHALVLGGSQGTGKDTLLEPVRAGVGSWNWQDIKPTEMLGRFNGWAKAVVVRINELRDLGESDRFAFYDHSKTYIAAPPDVIRVDEKNLREHYVWNVMGVILTTNHKTDGLYLPADDRRHFVAWSEAKREDFAEGYWRELWGWYEKGGIGDVVAFLRGLDLSSFDPKAEPPKTAAFWAIVQTNEAPEAGELRDVLEKMGAPSAMTIADLALRAEAERMFDLASDLRDRKTRRSMPHKLERVGYVPVRNPDAEDGLFKIEGKRQAMYAKQILSLPQRIDAARAWVARRVSQVS